MKFAIIIETKEHEKAWNAFRFAVSSSIQGHNVKVFLLGDGVECRGLTHDTFNVDEQLKAFIVEGGEIMACGTCLEARGLIESESIRRSTMIDCVEMVAWADRVITFG